MAKRKKRALWGEEEVITSLHSPYEDGERRHGGGRGRERSSRGRNQTKSSPWSPVCVCVCKSVCQCVCGCADFALLSEGCIRVAWRKGHRTTVVLQKKGEKKEPQSRQNQNFLMETERAGGKGEGVPGVGTAACGNKTQDHGRIERG